jgi:acylphosphatase
MKTAVNLVIIGNLYKSGFRFYAQKKGIELGIVGTIAYQGEYGDIIIHAEGEEEIITEFTEWCKKGLPYCKVQNVEVRNVPIQDHNCFDIISTNIDTITVEETERKKKKSFGARIFGF